MPIGDAARRGPRDADRPLDNERRSAKVEFGATCDCVTELPHDWRPMHGQRMQYLR